MKLGHGRLRQASIILTAALVAAGVLATSASAFPKYNFFSSFGEAGFGNGKLNEAEGLAVTSSGDVYVADKWDHQIEIFNSSGGYVGQFGKPNLFKPRGIAIDSSGNRWVVDENYLVKFNSSNVYVTKYGGPGTGNGQINGGWDLDIDSKGNIWVLDAGNQRVQKFNSAGAYVRQIKSGTYSGHEFMPGLALAVDSTDNVWVDNSAGGEGVVGFDAEGLYFKEIASEKYGPGWAIEQDSEGRIWVSEYTPTFNYMVAYSTAGLLLGQFGESAGFEEPDGHMFQPIDLVFDANGNPLVLNLTTGNGVQRWLAAPDAVTKAPTNVGLETVLNGGVNPNGTSTSYLFEWGTTTAYGKKSPTTFKEVGSGTTEVALSKQISTEKETTYHYRIVATSAAGTTYGQDVSFYTGVPAHNTSPPVISPSTPTKGVPVTTTNGTWTGEPAPTFSYRWERCKDVACAGWWVIEGAKSSTYTPVAADVGYPLRSVVTGRNGTGVEIVKSSPTAPVKP